MPAKQQAALARAYALSICKAHGRVQRRLRQAIELALYELEQRSTVSRQSRAVSGMIATLSVSENAS